MAGLNAQFRRFTAIQESHVSGRGRNLSRAADHHRAKDDRIPGDTETTVNKDQSFDPLAAVNREVPRHVEQNKVISSWSRSRIVKGIVALDVGEPMGSKAVVEISRGPIGMGQKILKRGSIEPEKLLKIRKVLTVIKRISRMGERRGTAY